MKATVQTHTCPSCSSRFEDGASFCPSCGNSVSGSEVREDSFIGRMVSQRYRIVRRIARGGMGEVFLAEHTELSQRAAVKFLHRRFADDELLAARFFNEARSSCRVNHPNAVALYDFGRLDDGTLYIVMEYVAGQSLAQVVKSTGPLTWQAAVRLAMQVCEVLGFAHQQRIIHRDVKPDNIMVIPGAGGRISVKVLDFGIAKILDDESGSLTQTGITFGTPEYMSPEQASGAEIDQRTDIYSLGLVLYYSLVGHPPFEAQNKLALLQRQIREVPPRVDRASGMTLPGGLVDLVEELLAKDPGERPESMEAVLDRLDVLAASHGGVSAAAVPVSADPASGPQTPHMGGVRENPRAPAVRASDEPVSGGTEPLALGDGLFSREREEVVLPASRRAQEPRILTRDPAPVTRDDSGFTLGDDSPASAPGGDTEAMFDFSDAAPAAASGEFRIGGPGEDSLLSISSETPPPRPRARRSEPNLAIALVAASVAIIGLVALAIRFVERSEPETRAEAGAEDAGGAADAAATFSGADGSGAPPIAIVERDAGVRSDPGPSSNLPVTPAPWHAQLERAQEILATGRVDDARAHLEALLTGGAGPREDGDVIAFQQRLADLAALDAEVGAALERGDCVPADNAVIRMREVFGARVAARFYGRLDECRSRARHAPGQTSHPGAGSGAPVQPRRGGETADASGVTGTDHDPGPQAPPREPAPSPEEGPRRPQTGGVRPPDEL